LGSGGGHKHRARLGAKFSVLLERVGDGAGPPHHLYADKWVFIDVGSRGELRYDLGPVGIHLIRQQHGQSRVDALPELKPVDLDDDRAV
jgi:hypothetical protein